MTALRRGSAAAAVIALVIAADATAGTPRLLVRGEAATATRVPVTATGFPPYTQVQLELRRNGHWQTVRRARTGTRGRARISFGPRAAGRHRLRASVAAIHTRPRTLRIRDVTLAAVGDINLGDGAGAIMRSRGVRYPWRNVAPTLRRADLAFGNLECPVSRRGRRVPKLFNFRGSPAALRAAARFGGLDVVNLANNHSGDYGRTAFRDTIRFTRRFGLTPVGGGADLAAARRPRVVRRLGLRIAFVGFSDRLPLSFYATPRRPGIAFASPHAIRLGVRRARRRADVVIATFHWGDERVRHENARQRMYARVAFRAGATAIIGAHPHVLQPRRRIGRRRFIAYSLGNFVFGTRSAATSRTGILRLRLSGRGVEGAHFTRGRIVRYQPRIRRH